MARNRKLQNRIGLPHITDEAEEAIAAAAVVSAEQVEDFVGGMLDGTETFIGVSYDDASGNLDFVVPVKDEDNMASNSAVHLASQQSVKAYVDNEVAGIVDSSPASLNTLNELAAALGDDANYAATTATLLGNRLRVDTNAQGLSSTQQSNALLNMGITATKAELNILDDGLSAGDIPSLATSKITSGTFPTARIADDAITAGKLFVSGNGSSTQFLRSDGDGSFSWAVPTDTNTQLSQEQVEDYVDGLLTNGSNITLTYNDSAGTLTIASQDTTYSVGDGGLTQNNFTNALKSKLDGIAASANNYSIAADLLDEDNMASNAANKVATQQSIKAYVDTEVAGIVDSAPAALNTLNELAAALGDDANYATTTSTALGNRVRTDTASQGLSGTQQANARTNIGLGTAATLSGAGAVADSNTSLVTGDAVYDYIASQNFSTSGASNFVIGDITGQTAITSGLASTDELVLSDAGSLKRMDISVVEDYMQNNLTFPDTNTTYSAGSSTDGITLDGTTFKLKDPDYGTHVTEAGVSLTQDSILFWDGSYDGWKYIKMENLQDLINTDTNTQLTLLDQDDMASNSATAAASQQSIKAYVDTEVAGIVDSAPTALNTLNELAAALGDDANYAATTTTSIGLKLAKASNLSDLADAAISRNNLGLDTAATKGVAANNASGVANGQGSLVTGNAVYQYVAANGGDSWGTAVDANIVPDNNNSRTLGSPSKKFGSVYFAGTSYNTLLSSADGSAPYPTYTFEYDENTGMYRGGTDILGFSTAGTSRITIAADGAVNFVASKIKLNNSYGSDGQVLTSTGSGVAWENAAGGSPAGSTGELQYNNNGSFAALPSAVATFNGTDLTKLTIGDVSVASGNPLNINVSDIGWHALSGTSNLNCFGGDGQIKGFKNSNSASKPFYTFNGVANGNTGMFPSGSYGVGFTVNGTERLRIHDAGQIGIGGANYGTSGQVLTSGGASSAPSWTTVSGGASALTGLSDATTSSNSVWLGSTPSNATDYNASLGIGALDALNGTNGTKNVAIGYNAGTANTEGFKNVFIGYAAGAANTNADNNVFIGSQAGTANTTGGYNTGVGTNALSQITTVTNNTALGYYAGKGILNGGNNVAVGTSALSTNNSATQNTAIGASSQQSNSGGNSNTSLGYRTLYALTSGTRNIAIGTQALDSTTTESDNIAIGFEALYNPNGATKNVVIGNYAGDGITSGSNNILMGHLAGSRITTSGNNIAIGLQTMDWATTGWGHNIAIGSDAMGQSATTGGRNIAIGSFALKQTTSDYGNVAVGYSALEACTSNYNTAVGDQAGKALTGNGNSIFGWNAGKAVTSGADNILIGKEAGDNITTGSNNIVIGKADPPSATASGQLSISSGNGGAVWITGDSAGVVNFPHSKIQLNGSYGSDGQVLTSTGSGVAWENAGGGGASALNDLTDMTSNITNFTDSLLISPDGAAGPTGTLSNASDNIGIGKDVFKDLTSGVNSVVVGNLAGENLTTGGHEVLVGFQAGSELTATQFNTLVGYRAGKNTKGAYNIALGATALQGHGSTWHTGDWNVAIGHAALAEVQGDSDGNIAIGRSALTTLTTGDENIAIGYEAGREMTTGNHNVLMGREAGQKITTASGNTHIGDNAGRFNTGSNNTFVGLNAGKRGTEGSTSNNTFVGMSVGGNNTGGDNTAMGHQAFTYGQNGSKNVAIGYYAGQRLTSTGAVVIGAEAGMNLTSGGTTVAIGYQALRTATTPQQQIAIGNGAGMDITTGNFNTLVGNYAGRKITTGFQNTAFGFNTMNAASSTAMTGSSNTAVGGNVMEDITSGGDNVGMGYNALREITTGSRNVAIGGAALDGITTINDNTAVGYAALGSGSMTGSENTAIGTYAGDALTSGNKNVLVGNQAGSSLTTGNHNTFIGYKAGKDTTTATEAIAIGDYALEKNTTGGGNVGIGHQALRYATTGLRNVAVGLDAGMSVTDGDRNTALGNDALRAVTTGSYNIGIGYVSGDNITEGSGNVVIGRADVPSATADNQLSISSGESTTPVWLTGNSSGVVDFPNGITSGGAAVGGAAYPHEIKTAGVNWYGSQQADIRLTSLPPYGVKAMTTFTFSTSSDYDKTIFFPFVAPKTGNLSRMNTYVSSGASGLNMLVGVYSDHNGYPATLLFKGTMDWSSGGNKTITSFTDASGNSTTPSLTKDTQYHVGWVRDDNGVAYTAYVSNAQYGPSSGLNLNMAEAYVGVADTVGQYGGSSNVLATSYNSGSPDWDDFTYFNASVKPINFGIKYA